MSHGPDSSVKEYYEGLGAAKYLALDVNERKDAIVADLNYPIVNSFTGHLEHPFDLITNNGTSEHLFNQGMVFENIHNICRQNGLMLHILPLAPWLNHGFYNYNPILFRDLARVNDYEIVFYWISNRWGDRVEIAADQYEELFKEKNPDELTKVITQVYGAAEIHKDVFNAVCFRKRSDNSFVFPIQGKYLKDVEGDIPSK